MPELPDIIAYIGALETRVVGRTLTHVRLVSPFLLRTFDPPWETVEGKKVVELRRVGKRIVFCLESDLFAVLHLMIAGRIHWAEKGAKIPGKIGLAAFDFDGGTLTITEAGTKKRASLHIIRGAAGMKAQDPGGLEPLDGTISQFREKLILESHTLKRSLTDPHLFSGIGNAYSDEILHRAKMSPLRMSRTLSEEEAARLHQATRDVLLEAVDRLRPGEGFPENVTA